jgi:hypothetical protein
MLWSGLDPVFFDGLKQMPEVHHIPPDKPNLVFNLRVESQLTVAVIVIAHNFQALLQQSFGRMKAGHPVYARN